MVALSSVAVVACGPTVGGGMSVWRERDRLAQWSAAWMPFLPPALPETDPRAKALVETLNAELAARSALAAENGEVDAGAGGDLALTIGHDGAWTLGTLPRELGWDGLGEIDGTAGAAIVGNRASLGGAALLPV